MSTDSSRRDDNPTGRLVTDPAVPMQRVLVCGGREYGDREYLFSVMDYFHERHGFTLVIHGGARGADALAGVWARARGVPEQPCPANWARYGKRAGILRNVEMLVDHKPDFVIAFPGGRGTADMVRRVSERKTPYVMIAPRVTAGPLYVSPSVMEKMKLGGLDL